ncbi:MAG TPA: FAD-dependent oxidoreductase, partial [Nannocystis exedens]|nr:FAD-dependent oxidoreductase [Nannocystis exedens]
MQPGSVVLVESVVLVGSVVGPVVGSLELVVVSLVLLELLVLPALLLLEPLDEPPLEVELSVWLPALSDDMLLLSPSPEAQARQRVRLNVRPREERPRSDLACEWRELQKKRRKGPPKLLAAIIHQRGPPTVMARALSDGDRRRSLSRVQSRTTELLVIGGGPGGATVATLAAQAGVDVILIEADSHPRVHVGESLLPGVIPILEAMGALGEVEAAGFARKSGSTHFGWGRTPEWDLWFADTDLYQHAWLVDRARFDTILLDAARRSGVEVVEHCAAKELLWQQGRLAGVFCRRRGDPEGATIRARLVVDATGQAALIARQRGLREHLPGLQHLAAWAHVEGVVGLPPPRHQQAVFVAERGHWIWFFPLGRGRASLGVISLDADPCGAEGRAAVEVDFDALLRASPKISSMLGNARRVTPVRRQRDW